MMNSSIKSCLIRGVAVMVMSLPMVGCHRSPTDGSAAGCSSNPYLMKYHCSLSAIQTAAENGDADAQYALGYMYYYGIDTVKDQQTAKLWIKRSADQGQPLAKKAWSLIDSNANFDDLHAAAAASTNSSTTGAADGNDSPTPSSTIVYQKPVNVDQMNSTVHPEPITKHLPGYGLSHNVGSETPLASLKKASPGVTDPRLAQNAKPVVAKSIAAKSVVAQSTPTVALAPTQVALNKPTGYTIQLMGSNKVNDVKEFVIDHHLSSQAHTYQTALNGKPWYMLSYGRFSTESKAEVALKTMAPDLKNNKPWVKSFAILDKEVQLQKIVA